MKAEVESHKLEISPEQFVVGNKLRYIVLLLMSLIFLGHSSLFAQEVKKSKKIETIEGKKYYIHEIGKGQTLYAIAHAYDLRVNDIVIENPEAIDGIKPGQSLKIPVPKEKIKVEVLSKSDSAKYYFHEVQQGETLYSISKFYAISIDKLTEMNPSVKEGLKVGQVIKMPADRVKANSRNKEVKTIAEKATDKNGVAISTVPATNVVEQAPVVNKTFSKADTSTKKNNFNVAMFLPFHVNETLDIDLDKVAKGEIDLPNKSEIAIQFYQGAQLAMDSLKKMGLNAKLFVYDIDENDSVQLAQLLKKTELTHMDLMIGPLYSSNFLPLSKYAKQNQIFITSPLSQQNKILFNNPFVSKVTGSASSQTEVMADYVSEKYAKEKIIVVNSGNAKDIPLVKVFVSEANKKLHAAGADSVVEVKGFGGIGNFIHSGKTSVIVVPSNNKVFITDFITKLNPLHEKNSIVLFGLQSWGDFDNLDLDYLSNLQMHYPASTFIDYENEQVKRFVRTYAAQFKTDPGEFVFQGFDVTYFYLNMLHTFGLGFQSKLAITKQNGLQTSFEFYQVSPESGFENKAVYMLMYQNNKLVKAN